MKLVTFTRDMRPAGAGEDRLLPDALADRLVAAGEATNPRVWPPEPVAEAAVIPAGQPRRTRTRIR